MIIINMKYYLLFIIFDDIYSMKDIINIYIIKFLDFSDSIHDFDDERYKITIFDDHSIKNSIIHIKTQTIIEFFYK